MWYRQYAVNEEAPGDGETEAGGGPAADGTAGATVASDPGPAKPPGGAAAEQSQDMAAAIDAGLGYKKPDAGADPAAADAEKKAAEQKAADEKAAADLAEKAKAGDAEAQKQLKEKEAAAAKAKADAAKPKDLKALELTPEEKKATSAKTQARFNEVLGIAKTERERADKAEQDNAGLRGSRDAILGVLKETNTTDDDLAQLLEYNRLTKSRNHQDLEAALSVLDRQRGFLLKALGKPGDGQDPLAAHADLQKEVEDLKITKERALEIAEARRQNALSKRSADRAQQEERASTEAQEKTKQAREGALVDIEKWAGQMAATDLDYKAKEDRVLAGIDAVIGEYPPHLWLPTIKRLYEAIVVQKAPPAPGKEQQPLRPSGAKPGGPAPKTMDEAIDQALGYAGK